MRLEQLNQLVEISRLQSLSRAAEILHISQPALSASIKNLEDELGKILFKRTNKGIFLTAEGRQICDQSAKILDIINEWHPRHKTDPKGKIHLLCTPVVSCYLTPNLIVPFSKEYPQIHIYVYNSQYYEIIPKLRTSSASIAVTTIFGNSSLIAEANSLGWENRLLFTDERRIFIGGSHPLAEKQELTAEDLKNLPLAFYSNPNDQLGISYLPYFGSCFRLANMEDIMNLVIHNEAACIKPFHLFRNDYRVTQKLIVGRKLPPIGPDPHSQIHALHAPKLSEAEQLFWDYLLEHFQDELA